MFVRFTFEWYLHAHSHVHHKQTNVQTNNQPNEQKEIHSSEHICIRAKFTQ